MTDHRRGLGAVSLLGGLLLAATARAADAPCCTASATPAARTSASAAEVKVVDAVLVDQNGAKVRLAEIIAGKKVVMSFIFTTCTTVCPVLTGIFSRLQQSLGPRLGEDVVLVTISVDPVRDTPARLKAYAAKQRARPGWTLLTGDKDTVDRVLKGLGAFTPDFTRHPPMVLVGDDRGRWVRFNGFPNHGEILAQVDRLATAATAGSAGSAENEGDARARQYFTDTELLTHDGKPVRFYSDVLKDRVVVISFIYTRCQVACPMIMSKLTRVKAELGSLFGKKVSFVSISVDPGFDTPQEMKKFAEGHKAAQDGWFFLTGKPEHVAQVLKKLGEQVERPDEHSTGFIAGNTNTRRWVKIRPFESPADIAARMRQLAGE